MRSFLVISFLLLAFVKADPQPCPSDPSILGYSDLASFRQDSSNGGTFVLCPNTEFLTTCTDELLISSSDTHVQCGADGSINNGCVLAHTEEACGSVLISEGLSNITLQGLNFTSGDAALTFTRESIFVRSSEVTLRDCLWSGLHMAVPPMVGAAVDVIRSLNGNLTLQDCGFVENTGGSLVYVNEGEGLAIRNTYAQCNELLGPMIFAQLPEGVLTMENTCFIDNLYNRATIRASIRTASEIDFATMFEEGSTAPNDRDLCLGLLQETTEPDGGCFPFEAESCSLAVEPRDCPPRRLTPAPTSAPTDNSSAIKGRNFMPALFVVIVAWIVQ